MSETFANFALCLENILSKGQDSENDQESFLLPCPHSVQPETEHLSEEEFGETCPTEVQKS